MLKFVNNKTMKTPNELFEMFAVIATEAKCGITDLMMKHNVTTLNTAEAMYDYGFDFVDISVYDRKMDAMFYEPISSVVLDDTGLHLFYNGETDGECYEPTTTDWMNVYSLVYDIFTAIDNGTYENVR